MTNSRRKLFLLALVALTALCSTAQSMADHFVTTWNTNTWGTSNFTSLSIPTYSGETYDYDVDWDNDGVFDEFGIAGNVTHDFGIEGIYTIRIRGTFPRMYFNYGGDFRKILSIDQWGNIPWTCFDQAFRGCLNLQVNASDSPDLSNVTSMKSGFAQCPVLTSGFSNWETSNVTDFSSLFGGSIQFNADVSSWNVSNATNLSSMFRSCNQFNTDLSGWDVSSVTNMSGIFDGCDSFNSNLTTWDVSSVTDMSNMFAGCELFNSDLSTWDVSSVFAMDGIFDGCIALNFDLSGWNVSNVHNLNLAFKNCYSLNCDLSNWDISNVTSMSQMLNNSATTTSNYDAMLLAWSALPVETGVSVGAQSIEYCESCDVRANFILSKGWQFDDSGSAAGCDSFCTMDTVLDLVVSSNTPFTSLPYVVYGPPCNTSATGGGFNFPDFANIPYIQLEGHAQSFCDWGGGYVSGPFVHIGVPPFSTAELAKSNCSSCDPYSAAVQWFVEGDVIDDNVPDWGGHTVWTDQPYPDGTGSQYSYGFNNYVGARIPFAGGYYYGYFHLTTIISGSEVILEFGDCVINPNLNQPITVGDVPTTCPFDISGDGVTDIDDFLMFNTAFGNACNGCPEDLTGDGVVDVNDFLVLNTAFGQMCP